MHGLTVGTSNLSAAIYAQQDHPAEAAAVSFRRQVKVLSTLAALQRAYDVQPSDLSVLPPVRLGTDTEHLKYVTQTEYSSRV